MLEVLIVQLPHAQGLALPEYQTEWSSGMDICAAVEDAAQLNPGDVVLTPTGFSLAIPAGYEGQIRGRSGLARKGIIVPNAPGTIDSDYRGEVAVLLANIGSEPFVVNRGDRIAQLVVAPVVVVDWVALDELDELGESERGGSGFGSTGVNSSTTSHSGE